jgi:uncharacterized membrane protein YphA (DoxX/SURF4 family)
MDSRSRLTALIAAALGLMMVGAGISKLVGESHQVEGFMMWELPSWFRMLVGTFEVVGGILLAVPATTPVGSLILSTIMVGAIWTHVVYAQWLRLVGPLALLILFLLVFRRTLPQAVRLLTSNR